ncbi:hypothetical protein SCOR_14975 [Sulfidibacter corallicola]|uniref:Uncharacterized protein n=1 Tax=Sulfidibacter corallicola TaxID=2818388 RepID=A0A8A4TYB1_SULCO|nr:hypothetical protein [Sulfidibacter corallicola]QTD54231.1 hypothetical protein J3U87_17440 [Sulfidibacter corallicola]
MPKNKSRKKKTKSAGRLSSPISFQLSSEWYLKYHIALLEGLEANAQKFVYWDLGPGERPQKVKAEFEHVAKREGILVRVLLAPGGKNLRLAYLQSGIRTTAIRVKGKDGEVKVEKQVGNENGRVFELAQRLKKTPHIGSQGPDHPSLSSSL